MGATGRGGRGGRQRPPLDADKLQALALHYVGRYATTRAKLAAYLRRKLRERGWSGQREADVDGLAQRFADQGYVDDAAFALAKSRALAARGYGESRLRQSLRAAGVDAGDGEAALGLAAAEAVDSALRFARRRRIGPYAAAKPDRAARDKAIAAMLRAGHGFGLSRAIVDLDPGTEPDLEEMAEKLTQVAS